MFRSILAITLSSLLFGCGGSGGSADNNFSVGSGTADSTCPDSLECGFFSAPKDYNNDDGDTVEIYYGVHKATDLENRIGILVFNFGGPGGDAVSSTHWMVEYYLPDEILERFDIIGMDPRGSGGSAFATELTECAVAADQGTGSCDSVYAEIAPYLGSNSVVQDLDQLRVVLGEDKLNFFGYSYGTRLGALYANRYPENVRAIVLDSPMSPLDENYFDVVAGQIEGFDLVVDYRLGFDETYKEQTINIVEQVDLTGSYTASDDLTLSADELVSALFASISYEASTEWATIKEGFFELLDDDTAGLLKEQILELDDTETTDESLRFSALYTAVMCTDEVTPLSYVEVIARQDEFDDLSALFAPFAKAWSTSCTDWTGVRDPIAIVENMENVLADDQKILVIAGQYDTNTPYFWGAEMSEAFGNRASLITVADLADHGFSYTGIACVDNYTTQYLLDPSSEIAADTCSGATSSKTRSLVKNYDNHPAKQINRIRH